MFIVMTDRYTKLMNFITTQKTSTTAGARITFDHWLANFGILSISLTKKGPQFVSKFFLAVCSTLAVNNITTIRYHSEINGQAERFNSRSVKPKIDVAVRSAQFENGITAMLNCTLCS